MSVKVNLKSHDMNDMQNYSRFVANYFIIGILMECMDFCDFTGCDVNHVEGDA